MDRMRFAQISKLFAERRQSRRAAVRTGTTGIAVGLGAAGLAAATAQEATPTPGEGEKVAYLFIQSFQAGALMPRACCGLCQRTARSGRAVLRASKAKAT